MMQQVVQNIEEVAKDVTNNIHTAMPAVIQSYDAGTGLCSVKPSGTFYEGRTAVEYPVISGVPLCISASKNAGIYFPINVGDSVLIIIAEQSITTWLTNTNISQSNERFELTNAIAIPNLQKVSLEGQNEANASGAVIVNCGGTKMKLTSGGVEITGSLKVSGGIQASGSVTAPNID